MGRPWKTLRLQQWWQGYRPNRYCCGEIVALPLSLGCWQTCHCWWDDGGHFMSWPCVSSPFSSLLGFGRLGQGGSKLLWIDYPRIQKPDLVEVWLLDVAKALKSVVLPIILPIIYGTHQAAGRHFRRNHIIQLLNSQCLLGCWFG